MQTTITIQNYEEFFLLYVDKELSAAEQMMVEQFVRQHPQLAEELEMMQQAKLPVEDLVFAEKEQLFRNGSESISLANYETWFLLYVDRELSVTEMADVETFVLKHPGLQEQFMLLKQTRLEPEQVVYPFKQSLYRKEEKIRPVVFIGWQRIAVAAALIGAVVITWRLLPGNTINPQNIFVKVPVKHTDLIKQGTPIQAEQQQQQAEINVQQSNIPSRQKQRIANRDVIARNIVSEPVQLEATTPVTKQASPVRISAEPVTVDANVSSAIHAPATIKPAENLAVNRAVSAGNNESDETIAQPAVYKELDTEDDKKSLYVGSIEINKDKLRGFFRKAGSLFRGKAKQQEEERAEATSSPSNTRTLR